jgi:predicted ester cyclase
VLSGDIAVHWGRIRGTAAGEFLGQVATGRSIDVAMTAIYEFRNGAINSERVFMDLATMAAQAGWDLDEIRTAVGLGTTSTP